MLVHHRLSTWTVSSIVAIRSNTLINDQWSTIHTHIFNNAYNTSSLVFDIPFSIQTMPSMLLNSQRLWLTIHYLCKYFNYQPNDRSIFHKIIDIANQSIETAFVIQMHEWNATSLSKALHAYSKSSL